MAQLPGDTPGGGGGLTPPPHVVGTGFGALLTGFAQWRKLRDTTWPYLARRLAADVDGHRATGPVIH